MRKAARGTQLKQEYQQLCRNWNVCLAIRPIKNPKGSVAGKMKSLENLPIRFDDQWVGCDILFALTDARGHSSEGYESDTISNAFECFHLDRDI